MKRIVSALAIFLGLLSVITSGVVQPALAQSNTPSFATDLTTTYRVTATGQVTVRQELTLTNTRPTEYVSSYGLSISSPRISNVRVTSNGQALPAEVVNTATQTTIGIHFPDEVVGEGKQRQFVIEYVHPDAAAISGRVLELQVPKLADPAGYRSYTVRLLTPLSFGTPNRTSPIDHASSNESGEILTTFRPHNGEGVSALFGYDQLFNLSLRYHLENRGTTTGLGQIALPPDTPYQRLNYQLLEPPPQRIEQDQDGNWIATYSVPSQNTLTVTTQATARVTLSPDLTRPQFAPLPQHTTSQQYWDINNSRIREIAETHTSPEAIYDYLIETLSYNQEIGTGPLERLGAVRALEQPEQAVCAEYTDLFVTLARANGIPARRLTGFAYTQDTALRPLSLVADVLHAWPEYYDESRQQWIPVDPTWGDTTGGIDYFSQLDLNHVVFTINGLSSTVPFPPASQNYNSPQDKDVEVTFTDTWPVSPVELSARLIPETVANVPIPGRYQLAISQGAGQALYGLSLELISLSPDITAQVVQPPPLSLLPFQTIYLPVAVVHDGGLSVSPGEVQLTLYHDQIFTDQVVRPGQNQTDQVIGFTTNYQVLAGPAFVGHTNAPSIAIVAVAGIAGLLALIAGSVLVLGFRRQRPVRRKSQKSQKSR